MNHYVPFDSTKTDSLGRYSLEFSRPPWDRIWEINIKDIDSTENGSFIDKDTVISIPDNEMIGTDDENHIVNKKILI